jgi:hypothetical protein
VHVRAGAAAPPTALRVRLGGGPLPAGKYALRFRMESASGAARFWLAGKTGDVVAGTPAAFEAEIDHPGGPLTLAAATAGSAIWIGEATVKSEP